MSDNDQLLISFSIKELLQDIQHKLERIDEKLDGKAEKSVVEALQTRVVMLEQSAATQKSLDSYKRWLVGLLVAVFLEGTGLALLSLFGRG